MMRFARLLIAGLLVISGVAFGGEADGPYFLMYYSNKPPDSPIITPSVRCLSLSCGWDVAHDPVSVESFTTLDKALERVNRRGPVSFFRSEHPEIPDIKPNDLIGLFKGRKIQLELGDSGRSVDITHEVVRTEKVPVQEWDVKQ